jgi:hypothetical protein
VASDDGFLLYNVRVASDDGLVLDDVAVGSDDGLVDASSDGLPGGDGADEADECEVSVHSVLVFYHFLFYSKFEMSCF